MDVVYAMVTALVPLPDGGRFRVAAGSHWPADDPVVLAQPSLFSTDPLHGLHYSRRPERLDAPAVEQATANPGERRAHRRG